MLKMYSVDLQRVIVDQSTQTCFLFSPARRCLRLLCRFYGKAFSWRPCKRCSYAHGVDTTKSLPKLSTRCCPTKVFVLKVWRCLTSRLVPFIGLSRRTCQTLRRQTHGRSTEECQSHSGATLLDFIPIVHVLFHRPAACLADPPQRLHSRLFSTSDCRDPSNRHGTGLLVRMVVSLL